ncbi:MAG: CHAT domain-containing tetratricopeptide repeat protein [Bacteroidota bacterium]
MKEKIIILSGFFLLWVVVLMAQCPPEDSIQKSIIERKIAGEKPGVKRLEILLGYRDDIIKCQYKKDATYAWLLQNIGGVYADMRNFSEAVNFFLQSIDVTRKGTNNNQANESIIDQYYWLATFYDSLNNGSGKRKAIDSCIAVSERLKYFSNASLIWCLLDRLQYFYNIGEYRLCINDAELCEKSALAYARVYTDAYNNNFGKRAAMSSFHWHINALLQLKNFEEAERLLANKAGQYKKEGPADYLALTYAQLAEVDEKRGDYTKSLADFNQALKTYRQNKNYFNCKQTLNLVGEKIYFRYLKDYDRALACFKEALTFINYSPSIVREDSIETLSIYGRIANVYIEKGLFDSAFVYFQFAFDQVKKGITVASILYSTPDEFIRYKKIDYLSNLLINYGDAYKKKYAAAKNKRDIEESIRIYENVDKFLARVNISQFEQDSKLLWRQETRRLYENAIEACYISKNAGKAFYFFERSRAVLLNIQLTEQSWLGYADISNLDKIKRKIADLNNVINTLPEGSKEKNILRDSLTIKNEEFYSLSQLIKNKYPLYYQNLDTVVLTITDVRNTLLKDRQAILEIFSGDSAVYSLLVTANLAVINKLEKNDFEKTVNSYTSYLSNYNLQNKDFTGFRKTAHHLYELILQNNPVPQGRIIISPEGYYFPFESLVVDNSFQAPAYFISNHTVSYTYSVRYLFNSFGFPGIKPAGNFLGVAPVNYSLDFPLSELSGSDLSLNNIESITDKGHILLNRDASRNNFLRQFPAYKIIQLYTHASDSSDRKEPVIYFNDSALYLSELIREEKPVTELIVLSACETGNGILYKGEGVFSFNRAFASLGIPSSVTNLWSVDNNATYEITESFYKYVAKGMPLDLALQKAKLEYMNGDLSENQLPYYWAAPILVGKSDKIILDKPVAWKYVFAGIILASLFLIGRKLTRKHKITTVSVPGKGETVS